MENGITKQILYSQKNKLSLTQRKSGIIFLRSNFKFFIVCSIVSVRKATMEHVDYELRLSSHQTKYFPLKSFSLKLQIFARFKEQSLFRWEQSGNYELL